MQNNYGNYVPDNQVGLAQNGYQRSELYNPAFETGFRPAKD